MKKSLSLILAVIIAFLTSCHHNDYARKVQKCSAADPFKNRMIKSAFFNINPAADTILEGNEGTVIALAEHCFLDENNDPVTTPVQVELAEAYSLSDILKSNLTTTADGKLLQTDGMIYINASSNGKQLHVDSRHPLHIEMPTSKKRPGMMAFKGDRDGKGNMNWHNPKQLEKYLIPINLDQLDFLPPGFADTVEKDATKEYRPVTKARTDSLYYSLSAAKNGQWVNGFFVTDYNEPYYNSNSQVKKGKYSRYSYMRKAQLVAGRDTADNSMCYGRRLFEEYCTSCHKLDDVLIGPALYGVRQRWEDQDKLVDFVQHPDKYIDNGDILISKENDQANGARMTVPPLSRKQVDAVLDYVSTGRCSGEGCGIDPARIKAIKSRQFQNTLISTREFETRLKYIFKSCNNEVLELYVSHLDKNMWQIDSMAAVYLKTKYPSLSDTFTKFAAERLTTIEGKSPNAAALARFYSRKLESIHKELADMNNKVLAGLEKQNKKMETVTEQYTKLLWKREKYRMEKYSFQWTDLGWINIDTGTVEKDFSSRQLIVNVSQGRQYEQVYTYMVYTSMKSIYRMNTDNQEQFYVGNEGNKEMLMPKNKDALIVCYAYNGKQAYLGTVPFNTGNISTYTVELKAGTEEEIEKALGKFDGYEKENRISIDLEYQAVFAREEKRQEQLQKVNDFFDRLWITAFPCCDDRIASLADSTGAVRMMAK